MLIEQRRHPAFTLLEVLAAIVIMAILAAVLYPTIGAQLRGGQSAALASQLDNIRQAAANYQQNVGQFPLQLTQLVNSPTTGALDLCGVALTPAERNRWRGPYLSHQLTGDLPIGDATAKDTFVRNPPTTATTQHGVLQVRVLSVDSVAAADLEAQFDGNGNYATGTILWTATGARIGTLTFQIPVRGC